MEYNEGIILEHAARINKSAENVELTWTVSGVLAGLVLSGSIYNTGDQASAWGAVIAFFVSVAIMKAIGRERAFSIYVKAHTIMLQVQIERNTRRYKTDNPR